MTLYGTLTVLRDPTFRFSSSFERHVNYVKSCAPQSQPRFPLPYLLQNLTALLLLV